MSENVKVFVCWHSLCSGGDISRSTGRIKVVDISFYAYFYKDK